MMAQSPSKERKPQVEQKTNDFLTLASAPVPERKHWAKEQRECEHIDDKFIEQPERRQTK